MSDYIDNLAFSVSVVLENDRDHSERIHREVAERLRDGMGEDNVNPERYAAMLAREGSLSLAYDVRDVVSDYVQDLVIRRLGGNTFIPEDIPSLLINGMFDFSNADLWATIAHRFIPERMEDYADILGWQQNEEGVWYAEGDCRHCGKRSGH